MGTDIVSKTLKSAETFLKRWNGGSAKISEITWAGLIVRLEKQGQNGRLEISCVGDIEIQGVIKITDANLKIENDGIKYIISDLTNNLKIYCQHSEIKEYTN
jgi:hypothetical protein